MNGLLTHPAYRALPPNMVKLRDVLKYENDKYHIEVFPQYWSDGGSLPRISWSILGVTPFDPRCVYAFLLHDFLYQSHLLPRFEGDTILDEVLSIPPACDDVQRWLIYEHVRLWGWFPYWMKDDETIASGRTFGKVIKKENKYERI